MLDKQQAKQILITELGYPPFKADLYLRDYPPIHEELAEAVDAWLQNRTILDVEVCGLAIREVMQIQHCHFLMAVRDLNRLLDPDLTSERRERLVQILRTGPRLR